MGVNGIYGLSGSGLDIESLVKMGMSGKNKQYDKMEQQEIANTWLKEAYNDVYNDLTKYKYGTLSDYKMQSNLNAMSATSNNSSMVTATANGAAAAMNHTVTVTSVASNAYLQTVQKDSSGVAITRANTDPNAKSSDMLADVMYKSYSVASATQDGNNWNFTYNIEGKDSPVNGSDVAISLKIKDSDAEDAKEYTLSYTYDELFTGMASGTYTGYTGDEKTLFEGGKTLYDLASAFAKTGANIQGGFDIANDAFSLYNKTSGKSNIIDITVQNSDTATLFTNLRLGEVKDNTLSDAIKFETPTAMETTMESTVALNTIKNSTKSVSMKDVLGLKATVDGDDTIVTGVNSAGEAITVGTFSNGSDTVFSMNLSNGTGNATVSFTLDELFSSNFGLDELASKINAASEAAGLGITAAYDAANDSFSLNNPTGQANLTAADGTGNAVAQRLADSLHLTDSPNITYLTVTNSDNLADAFGLHSTMSKDGSSFVLSVLNGSSTVASQKASKSDFITEDTQKTLAEKQLFSFTIKEGDKSATVQLTYGDMVDYSKITNAAGSKITVINSDGTPVTVGSEDVITLKNSKDNNLGDLVERINKATSEAGINVTAEYKDGKFSLLNKNGSITIVDAADRTTTVGGDSEATSASISYGLSLGKTAPSSMAYKTSAKIDRVVATSSDESQSVADVLGIVAVKNGSDKLTVKIGNGAPTLVDVTATAFKLKVSDGTSEEEVAFTYADLFDTEDSGNLKAKAGYGVLVDKLDNAVTGVKAEFKDGKLCLTNEHGDVTLTGVDELGSNLVSMMGIKESEETKGAKEAAGQLHRWKGTNASVTIDGKTYDNDTNKLTVAGVTYTFLDKAQSGQTTTISVSQDTDKIVDFMKSFVDEYNTLLDSLNDKLSEKKYSDYKPLSKRQEEEMTEKQIEKWTEKAKSGLLYHNSDIQALVSAMREAIYTKVDAVDSQYNTLSSIGITSTNTKGHLTLDTDKLKKALADDPDCVYQLFASDQDSTYIAGSTNKNKITTAQSKMDYANTGVANRLYNVMTNHMSKISDIAGTSKSTDDQSYLGKLITNMQTQMKSFKTLMTSYENKLYKRYDAMEVALSRLNMQLGYISGSFS